MIVALIQLLLAVAAGYGIFLLWRRIAATSRPIFWLVTIGVLARAIGGQLAFWISYASLPVARSMQIGRGLWLFALDAMLYFDRAMVAASQGPLGVIFIPRTESSVFFKQVLATAVLLFGKVTAVGILINVAAYLGCCAMVLSFGRRDESAVIGAIAVLSLAPSAIIWSLQPLKDVCFLFLVAAFFAVARVWQQLWSASVSHPARAALWTVILFALLYGMSGIRWYFGLVVVIAAIPFAILTITRARLRTAALIASMVLLPALATAFFAGAGPYVPPRLRAVLFGSTPRQVPSVVMNTLDESRDAFDRAGGASLIGAGSTLRKIDSSLGGKTKMVAAVRPAAMIREGETAGGTVTLPTSPVARLLAGAGAVVLPRVLAQRIGILEVGGGRGMWLFVEIDTLIFDLMLVFSAVLIVRAARQRRLRAPIFWMVLVVTGAIAVALSYTVSNFGTLFRHRDMVLLCLAFLPLAALQSSPEPPPSQPEAAAA